MPPPAVKVDYAAMTQEVQRTLAQLTSIQEPKKRLEIAEQARARLLDWATGTYGYRATEVRELTGLFDDVIAELRAAAGERKFAVELRSGPAEIVPEPILAVPTLAEVDPPCTRGGPRSRRRRRARGHSSRRAGPGRHVQRNWRPLDRDPARTRH
jgi:hypothetical protein